MNDYSRLLACYDRPGPRYTSYPTAPVWRDDYTAEHHRERLQAAGQRHGEPLSLYVHIPYCNAMCYFCGCATVITQRHDKEQPYVDRVLAEAALTHAALVGGQESTRPIAQHHWGGGTPTFLGPERIERLFEGLRALFPLADGAEVSIEVDPRVTTQEQLATLARSGFNRISMGVQDFDPKVQHAIHRVQSFDETEAIVRGARDLGFLSVNVDLVYGLPFQSIEGFQRTLEQLHRLSPDRIACYSYAHVPWLKKHQTVIPEDALPRGADKLALYLCALQSFVEHGYEAIGMDHFAKRDDELAIAARRGALHRNFMGYTTQPAQDMIAFGMSSISEVDGAFAQNEKTLPAWEGAVDAHRLPVVRGLRRTEEDERRRSIILDLICRFGVTFADHGGAEPFRQRYATELQALEPMVQDGLLTIDPTGLRVTEVGRLFVRNLCMAFDAHLPRDADNSGPRFSRTV